MHLRIGIPIFFCFFLSVFAFGETAELPDIKTLHRDSDEENSNEEPERKDIKSVGKELERFGEEVAGRIDKIVSKKGFRLWGDPWTVQGIPLIFPTGSAGFNLGINLSVTNIRREDPHQFEFQGQVLASDKGRYKHFVKVDFPHFSEGKYRLTASFAYNRDITFRYFGVSNDTPIDPVAVKNDAPLYQNTRTGPSFTVSLLRNFGQYFKAGPLFGLKWTEISYPSSSLLAQQRPSGINGGRTHYIGAGFVYDTLDFEPDPTRGNHHEIYFNWHHSIFGSDYDFLRVTYNYQNYISLHRRLIYAHRVLLEGMTGVIPYYELGATGGSNPTIGFGGDRFMRGYDGNRFIDQIKGVFGAELRWNAATFSFAKQEMNLSIVPFVDIGRVWSHFFPFELGTIHASTGWGARLVWNHRYVLRSDFAINPEGTAFYVELGHSF